LERATTLGVESLVVTTLTGFAGHRTLFRVQTGKRAAFSVYLYFKVRQKSTGVRETVLEQQRGLKHVAFQRNMYNRLLFDCPEVQDDVIFATVSNQCPQRPPVRETLPALKLQQKV
jgi:hypothetical protein